MGNGDQRVIVMMIPHNDGALFLADLAVTVSYAKACFLYSQSFPRDIHHLIFKIFTQASAMPFA
jgi:uncharacterized protein (DUF305 family)